MKKNLFAAGSLLLLVSCAGSASYENLPGHWIESMPANPQIVQGIRLDADGGAASIGMHTLRYVGWERHGDRLVLRGRSIGNDQTLDFSDTLEIIRLDADTMSLGKEGRYRVDYARADFMTSGGYSLLDSLAMPSSGSVLDIRRFGGLVQTLSGDAACTLTLYTYDNGGDGVYRFVTNPGTDAAAEQVGRMFTLRGDATDENAVVYELRPFEGGATLHFRFLGDRLEWLDGALAPTDASGKYTLTRK